MTAERRPPIFFVFLVVVAAALLGAVLLPIARELVVAATIAAVLWPLQEWLTARLGGRRGVAAAVLTIASIILLVGPLTTLIALIVRQGDDGLAFINVTARGPVVTDYISRLPDAARDVVNGAIAQMPATYGELAARIDAPDARTASAVGAAVAATGSLVFHATLMFIALFFLLVRGGELLNWLDSVSPLRRGQTHELFTTFRKVSYSVLVATIATSAVQAIAALVGYLVAGVPSPFFFAVVTFFLAFVPAIGAAVVSLVAALLLFASGHPYMAGFLVAWGVVVVGLADNVVRPLLTRRGMEIHGAIVFFSLIGGLAAFGAIGLLLGPLVVALFLALLRMYHRDFTPEEGHVPPVPGLPGGQEARR